MRSMNFEKTLLGLWILSVTSSHQVVLSQKVPFAEHYDEAHRSRTSGENNQWANKNKNDPYSNNNSGNRNSYDNPVVRNQTYNTKFDDRDLRDNPDHSVNWLSPNPFASGSGNTGINRSNPSPDGTKPQSNSNFQSGSNQNSNYPQQPRNPLNPADRAWDQQNYRTQTPFDRNRNASYPAEYDRREFGTYDRNRPNQGDSNFNVNSNTVPVDPFGQRRDEDGGIPSRSGTMDRNSPYPQNLPNYPASGSRGTQDSFDAGRTQGTQDNFNPGRTPFPFSDVGPKSNYPSNYPSSASGGGIRRFPGTNATYFAGSSNPNPGVSNYPAGTNYPGGSSTYPGAGNSNYPNSPDRSNYPGSTYGKPTYSGSNPYDSSSGRANFPPLGNYPGRGNFDPGYPNVNIWNEYWTTTTYRPTAPGVLGRWRSDLQGQQRAEDINQVPQSVYVMTTFGRVQVSCFVLCFVLINCRLR